MYSTFVFNPQVCEITDILQKSEIFNSRTTEHKTFLELKKKIKKLCSYIQSIQPSNPSYIRYKKIFQYYASYEPR